MSPSIQIARAGVAQVLQRRRQVALAEEARRALIGWHRRQAVGQVDRGRRRIAPDHRGGIRHLHPGVPVLRQAAPRQRDRRGDDVRQRQPPPLPQHEVIAGDRGRDGDGERAVDVDVALDLRPGEQVGGHAAGEAVARGIGGGRGTGAEVHHMRAAFTGAVHQREADAAEAGVPWLDGGERQRGGDRGVDRIAAGIEHRYPSLCRAARLRDDHAAAALGRWLGQFPELGDVRRGGVLHGGPPMVPRWSDAWPLVARAGGFAGQGGVAAVPRARGAQAASHCRLVSLGERRRRMG